MSTFKKILKMFFGLIVSIVVLLLILVLALSTILFFNPTSLVNPKNINYFLSKTHVLKSWSWKTGEMKHKWIKWNNRNLSGNFRDLCFVYEKNSTHVDTCLEEITWDFNLLWTYQTGFSYSVKKPFMIRAKKTIIELEEPKSPILSPPLDYLSYWNLLWSDLIPDLNFDFKTIAIVKSKETKTYNLSLIKTGPILWASSLNYQLEATPKKLEITAPQKIRLPFDLKTKNPLYFNEIKLSADILESSIPLMITGKIASAKLFIKSRIAKSSLNGKLSNKELVHNVMINTTASLQVEKLINTIRVLMRPPFNIMPTPFNSMEGSLKLNAVTYEKESRLFIKVISSFDLKGSSQFFILDLVSDFPFDIQNKSVGSLTIGLDFKKVLLHLPKFSKTKLPPQLKPDPRFKIEKIVAVDLHAPKKKKVQKKRPVILNLEAIGENALQIKTNLLDEVLKLNLKLSVSDKTIQNGFIETLPLKTTVFKRPIFIPGLKILFDAPLEPTIISTIEFHLPEYLVTLKIAGPLSKPRTAFFSVPPLPPDDIIAVLLFGRPLSSLNPEDKTVTKDASQIISQGVLSLAVLYYLAGSPVESIGYDPDTKVVSAQFGLGTKNSLHVESGKSGQAVGSYGLRHALGKGWYIDSSVEQNTSYSDNKGKNLGVLLERIIAY